MIVSCFILWRVSPALAVHDVTYGGNDVFQLDGAGSSAANADTCVGLIGSGGDCSTEEQIPSWPADWDALMYPDKLVYPQPISPNSNKLSGFGSPGAAGFFKTPWGTGVFSGVFTSTFVGGLSTILKQGSKNTDDISQWVVAQQHSPPKDAIVAGAVATYTEPPSTTDPHAGDELLYHAVTRYASNGSATEGIWFLQDNVEKCQTGPYTGKALCEGTSGTLAHHENKDLFLFITFGGNGLGNIQAAEWMNGSLQPATVTQCGPGTSSDEVCAVTNEAPITLGAPAPDGFQAPGTGFNVQGPNFPGFAGGVVPALQFQEGGIDLTQILGSAPCFSTVMFATVSSGSSPQTASLKAILLGHLNTCAIEASKHCRAGTANVAAGTVTYPIYGTVSNIGGGAVQNLSLSDMFSGASQSFDGSPTCTCGSTGCSITDTDCSTVQLNPGGAVDYSASVTTSNNGGSDVITATMNGSGGGSATAQSNTATCHAVTLPSSVSINKSCGNTDVPKGAELVAQDGLVAVKVGVGGTVSNLSSDLPLSDVTVYDCVGATFGTNTGTTACPAYDISACADNGGVLISEVTNPPSSSLGVSGSTTATSTWSDTYFPTVAPTPFCPPYTFGDQALVTASCTSVFCDCPTVEQVYNASCDLCSGGSSTCPSTP